MKGGAGCNARGYTFKSSTQQVRRQTACTPRRCVPWPLSGSCHEGVQGNSTLTGAQRPHKSRDGPLQSELNLQSTPQSPWARRAAASSVRAPCAMAKTCFTAHTHLALYAEGKRTLLRRLARKVSERRFDACHSCTGVRAACICPGRRWW